MGLQFSTDLPADEFKAARPGRRVPWLDELRANPGQWAEVRREALAEGVRNRVVGWANAFRKRNADIEYTVRNVGTDVVAFMRSVKE